MPLRKVTQGQRPSAEQHNLIVDHVLRNHAGGNVFVDSGGVYQRGPVAQAGNKPAARMRITAIDNDYLEGKLVAADGTLGTETIQIAKPPQLRHTASNYSGIASVTTTDAQNMDASDGSTTESLRCTPLYLVGGEIFAVRPRGGTGLDDAPRWQDANYDGRQWAKVTS